MVESWTCNVCNHVEFIVDKIELWRKQKIFTGRLGVFLHDLSEHVSISPESDGEVVYF